MMTSKTVKAVDFRNAKGVLSQRRAEGDTKPQMHLIVSKALVTTPQPSPRLSQSRFFQASKDLRLSEIPGFDMAVSIRASKAETDPVVEQNEEEFALTPLAEMISVCARSLKMQGLTVSLLNSPRESFEGEAGAPNVAHVCAPITKTLKPSAPEPAREWTLASKRRGYGRAAKANSLVAPGRRGRSRSFGKPKHNPGRDQTHKMVSWRPAEGQQVETPSRRSSNRSRSRSPAGSAQSSRGSGAPRFVNSRLNGKKQIGFSKKMTDSQKVNRYPRIAPKAGKSTVDWEIKVDYPLQQANASKQDVDIFGKRFGRCGSSSWRRN